MPSNTTNYGIPLYDEVTDSGQLFIDFRDDVNGTGVGSAMNIIDTTMKQNEDAIVDLAGGGRTTETVKTNADSITSLTTKTNNSGVFSLSTSGTNTYTGINTYILSYYTGLKINLQIGITNTGVATLNINGLGIASLKSINGEDFKANELKAGEIYSFQYNGSEFRCLTVEKSSTSTTTQISPIATLPTGTVDAPINNVNQKGLTLVQDVVNGDFSDGTSGWTHPNSTSSVSNNVLSDVGTGNSVSVYEYQDLSPAITNDKWFLYAKQRVLTSLATYLRIQLLGTIGGGSSTLEISNPTQNEWYEQCGILTIETQTGDVRIRLQHQYLNLTDANGSTMEVDGNAGVFAINMTALGIEDYTEAQMLDLVRQGYFEGIANVENSVVETVGKNLFNKLKFTDNYYVNNTSGDLTSSTSYFSTDFIAIEENTQYRFNKAIGSGVASIGWYDKLKRFISSSISGESTGFSKTSPIGACYLRSSVNKPLGGTIDNYQIEKGAVDTDYEEHKSSILSTQVPLRSLPNGVTDETDVVNGEVIETKRVEEYVLQSVDFNGLNTVSFANVDIITIDSNSDMNGYGNNDNLATKAITSKTMPLNNKSKDDSGSYFNHYFAGNEIVFIVPKGTYVTLAEAQADLVGTVIQYQLATPQTINLTEQGLTDGQLLSFENGSMYLSSDTFHAETTVEVAVNQSARIDSVVEGVNANAKAITSKADKVQEDIIKPTLLNGWVDNTSGYAPAGYRKNDFGVVETEGTIKNGIATAGTTLFTYPIGYRPLIAQRFIVAQSSTFAIIDVNVTGELTIASGANTLLSLAGIKFRVEV